MKSAVIKTGGKQYVVSEGDTLKIERLSAKNGEKVNFTDVLLTSTEKTTSIGTPMVSGAKVEGKILRHGFGPKVTGVKMKAKKRNRKFFGHRQQFTEISITKIATK